jgi:Ca2+-binding RTX toxin-like protein
MSTLTVGFGQQYSTIKAAVAASKDGDILQVQAGTYVNDFAEINTKITLQGMGGMVKMEAIGWIPNEKAILITNTDVTIDHFEFVDAVVSSQNGAGIRYQGGNLTITNSYFHENQNGILSAASPTGTITIRNSEFGLNGGGMGNTHNLYIGDIAKLTVDNSYFHDAIVGHELKSRAAETIITNSRLLDNASNASYNIDLPNGGTAVVTGNVIQQGVNSENSNMITFGVEGSVHANSSLTLANNTIINDVINGNIMLNSGDGSVTMTGNQVFGAALTQLSTGPKVSLSGTTTLAQRPTLDLSHPWSVATAPAALPNSGVYGTAADDTITGTTGADNIYGGEGRNYLRGDDGADRLTGGTNFDDMNGNQGSDTLSGGEGNDWVVGGQDNDFVFGDDGNDLVYGNRGDDVCYGGNGADTVRGGQGNDVVYGGIGNDWLFGDRGDDTIAGGFGADTFVSFGDAGVDRVVDFDITQGDRVIIEAGTTYSVLQSGADVVINMSGGAQMILTGVSLASLGAGWIISGY